MKRTKELNEKIRTVEFLENNAKWRGCTSFTKDDEKVHTSLESKANLKISVTYGHLYHPEEWVMCCYSLNIETQLIDGETAEEAVNSALAFVEARLKFLQGQFEEIKL